MSIASNKLIVQKYFEMWNTGEVALAGEVLSPGYRDLTHPEITGVESVKRSVLTVRNAFPDFLITVDKQIGEGDMVAVMATISRSRDGLKLVSRVVWFVTVVDGKMVELETATIATR